MLLTPAQIIAATQLTASGISHAFERSGYEGEKFESAKFEGMTEKGVFVYSVTFYDHAGNGELIDCKVYVRFKEDPATKLLIQEADY